MRKTAFLLTVFLLICIRNGDALSLGVGFGVGTSFATPLVIPNLNLNISGRSVPFVLEIGCDAGFIHGFSKDIKDIDYFSLYPYGRLKVYLLGMFGLYIPLGRFGSLTNYLSAGGGYMIASYTYPEETKIDPVKVNTLCFDVGTGFSFSNFRIDYTIRTDFYGINHKLMIGYTFYLF
jgi:hypothetical protein